MRVCQNNAVGLKADVVCFEPAQPCAIMCRCTGGLKKVVHGASLSVYNHQYIEVAVNAPIWMDHDVAAFHNSISGGRTAVLCNLTEPAATVWELCSGGKVRKSSLEPSCADCGATTQKAQDSLAAPC